MKKRIFSWLLAVVMCAGVLPAGALAAVADTAQAGEGTLEFELMELPSVETSAQLIEYLSLDNRGMAALKPSNEINWIDRLDLSDADYATTFYQWLVENSARGGLLMNPTDGVLLSDGVTYAYEVTTFTGEATFTYTPGNTSANKSAAVSAISGVLNSNFSEASAYLAAVYAAFDRDYPAVFWLDGASAVLASAGYSYNSNGVVTYTQKIYFALKSDGFDVRAAKYRNTGTLIDAYDTHNQAVSNAVNTIRSTCSETTSVTTLLRTIHDYLTESNCYNTSSNLNYIDHDCREFISALNNNYIGTTGPVCEGYARAFKVFCDRFDIPCVLVDGTAYNGSSNEPHMWNYVQLNNGEWYAVDVTWDDPAVYGISTAKSGYENYDYFLVGSDDNIGGMSFISSHPVSNSPVSNAPSFTNGPVLQKSAYATICGTCGDNVSWALDEYGTLTISGNGAMANYSSSITPGYATYSEKITKIILEDGVTSIGDYAFFGFPALTSVNLPTTLTTVGEYAFSNCEALTQVAIPEGVTTIDNMAFCHCSALAKVILPSSLTSIKSYSFGYCAALTEVDIPEGTTTIGGMAFYYCTSLAKVTLPASLTTLGEAAFSGCESLTEVNIPRSVSKIAGRTFSKCSSLTSITVDENNPNYVSVGGVLFEKDMSALCCYPAGKQQTSYTVPEGVTSICAEAFWCANNLRSVILPSTLISIDADAFYACSSLADITLPSALTYIGAGAFWDCKGLTEIVIPASVTRISSRAFDGCTNLASVTFLGNAPAFREAVFGSDPLRIVTATCYYPANNATWTEEIQQNCGGALTWVEFEHPDSSEENTLAVSNIRFKFASGRLRLCWDAPNNTTEEVRYKICYSTDGGETWPGAISTSQTELSLTSLRTAGTYNSFRVVTVLDGIEVATCSTTDLTLTLTEGEPLAPAKVVFTAPVEENGNYTLSISGLTPGAQFCFAMKHTRGSVSSTSACSDQGTYILSKSASSMADYLADSTSVYRVTEFSCFDLNSDATVASFIFSYRGTWTSIADAFSESETPEEPDEPVASPYSVSNIHFEKKRDCLFLCWDTPERAAENLSYRIYTSMDNGGTWSVLTSTNSSELELTTFNTPNTYNGFRITTVLNGTEVATYSTTDLTLTITQGETLAPANVTLTAPEEESEDYALSISGLTPGTRFIFSMKYKNGGNSIITTCSTQGTYASTESASRMAKYLADDTSAYSVREFRSIEASEDGKSASFTICNRGGWFHLADAVVVPVKLDVPELSVLVSASSGKPYIKWSAVDNATGYEVYYSNTKTGTYTKLVTTVASKLNVTHTGAKVGQTYFYKVRAINDEVKGELSTAKGVWCDLARPTVTVVNRASDGKPTISWTKVDGATSYEVYRSTSSNGSYTKMYTATASKLSVTHTGAEVGKTYFYKVRAVYGSNTSCNSALSAAKGVWCDLKCPSVTVTNRLSDGKPTISWTKVDGATGYKVYYSETSKGTYKALYTATATKLNVTHTGAKAGEDYYYKVQALYSGNSKCDSAISAAKGVWCDLARPNVTISARASDGKPTISWSAVSGADKYQVVYCTSQDSTYRTLYTTTSAAKLNVTHTGAKAGVTYFYKVRAIDNDNAKCSSAYSSAKSITIK